jgi:diguanylate cyclase (GGDEF)-like protein/PAS domain S-box-containing protein
MKTYLRPRTVALITLGCGVALSVAAWFFAARQVERAARADFDNQASLAASLVDRRVQRYVDLLYGLEALSATGRELSRADFRRHVSALQAAKRFPGVQAMQFIRRVPGDKLEAFVKAVRADRSIAPGGYPRFDVRPREERPEHWVIDYVEPIPGNEAAFGLDLQARSTPRFAMERARDTAEPVATGRYRLAQEKGTSYGLVIYLPIFQNGTPRTLEGRRELIDGWVNVVMRIDDVFKDTLASPVFEGIRLTLHDLGALHWAGRAEVAEGTLFYRSSGAPGAATESAPLSMALRRDVDLPFAGRAWRLQFEADPAPAHALLRPLPMLTLGAGLTISLLLYGILQAIARTRTEAVEVATEATRNLRSHLSFSEQLLEAIPYPVYFKDADGRYLGCNRAFEEEIGIARGKLTGLTPFDILPKDDAQRLVEDDRKLIESGGVHTLETRTTRPKDGQQRDAIFSKSTFSNADGRVAGIVGVIVDITDRKELEDAKVKSHEQLHAIVAAAPLAIIVRDFDSVIRVWNPAAERLFGWKAEEVINTATSIVPDELRHEVYGLRERAQAGELILIDETQRVARDGTLIDVSLAIAPLRDASGGVYSTMVTIADIRPRKEAERALGESEDRLKLAMEAAHMGLWYWDAASDDFTYSDGLNTLFGRSIGAPHVDYRLLQETLHPDDRGLLQATLRHAVKAGQDFQIDCRVVWPDGSSHWVANRGQVHRGPDGRALRLVGIAMDITERKLAEQRIAHMAHHDALTGLPNRVLLHDRIRQAIAQSHRAGTQVGVLFIDLDRFKTINDSLGHPLGDRLLQSVASRLLVCLREGDTVSRLGGDEFVIVVPDVGGAAGASAVAGKILEVLSSSFHLQGNDLHVSASVGISLYPSDGADSETLMRNADTAMYHAKDAGRSNFQFFTPHMNISAQQRLSLENALRRALDNQEFELYFQPLYDLRDRSITGLEALLRWHPKGRDPVPPNEFIPAAEESGLIVPIGEWALREALRHGKAWQAAGRPLYIAINVSATQLARTGFAERLRRMLHETGIDPALVELEVTERVIVEGTGEARKTLDQVAALGVGIAIDDFGTGYSGLAYLKRFPIDTVKVDQSFVRDITVDPDDAAIVTAIIAMANSLGIDVVAEGVETEEQLEALRALGCHRAQGYFLARPMSARDVTKLLGTPPASAAAD